MEPKRIEENNEEKNRGSSKENNKKQDEKKEVNNIFNDKKFISFIYNYHKIKAKFPQISKEKLQNFFRDILIPILIFVPQLGVLESIVKYLKENLNLNFSDIAKLLGKSNVNIRVEYFNSLKKYPKKFYCIDVVDENYWNFKSVAVPLSIFRESELSMLECLVKFLKEDLKLKFSEISVLIKRDQRTIWTIYRRVISKETNRETSKEIDRKKPKNFSEKYKPERDET